MGFFIYKQHTFKCFLADKTWALFPQSAAPIQWQTEWPPSAFTHCTFSMVPFSIIKDGIRVSQTVTQQKQNKPKASSTPQMKSLADESFLPQPHKLVSIKPLKKHKTLTRFQSPGFPDWTARCHKSPSTENIPSLKWLRPSLRDHSALSCPNLSVSINVKNKQQQQNKKKAESKMELKQFTDRLCTLI